MKKASLFLPVILLALVSFRTDSPWKFLSDTKIQSPANVSTDHNGFIYSSDESGNIYKYDSLCSAVQVYSTQKNTAVSLLEANRGVNVFIFYREYQQYRLLNRFLTEISTNSFDGKLTGFVRLATLSADNNLWVIDDNDFSLKKINLSFNRTDIENPLQLVLPPGDYDFVFMREYDNRLYIADRNSGILVFDNMGNYLTNIPCKDVNYFNFIDKTLYFVSGEKLHLVDTGKGTSQLRELPEGVNPLFVILKSKRAYIFTPSSIELYEHSLSF